MTEQRLSPQAPHTPDHITSSLAETQAQFYDCFAETFVRDWVSGNSRVDVQRKFILASLPASPASVLVIGCGLGQVAAAVAKQLREPAKVLGVDLSEMAIKYARALFRSQNLAFAQGDVLADDLEGSWDVIVLPDVYEHIPRERRDDLGRMLNRLLAPRGVLVLTCPHPRHQAWLRSQGYGLQPVDEDVTLADVGALADQVSGTLIYYRLVSVWRTGDYFHAAIQRLPGYEEGSEHPLGVLSCLLSRKDAGGNRVRQAVARGWHGVVRRLVAAVRQFRLRRARSRLG